jgi:hypothetical protein
MHLGELTRFLFVLFCFHTQNMDGKLTTACEWKQEAKRYEWQQRVTHRERTSNWEKLWETTVSGGIPIYWDVTSRLVDIHGRFGIKNRLNLQGRCDKVCYLVETYSFGETCYPVLVNKTNRRIEFQFYWYYDSTCLGQPFCPSSGVLSRTSALVHFMQE